MENKICVIVYDEFDVVQYEPSIVPSAEKKSAESEKNFTFSLTLPTEIWYN